LYGIFKLEDAIRFEFLDRFPKGTKCFWKEQIYKLLITVIFDSMDVT